MMVEGTCDRRRDGTCSCPASSEISELPSKVGSTGFDASGENCFRILGIDRVILVAGVAAASCERLGR